MGEIDDIATQAVEVGGKKGSRLTLQVLSLLLSLVTAAGVGVVTVRVGPLTTDPAARPDPFTGTEGRRLEERLERLSEANRRRIEALEAGIARLSTESAERMARVETMFAFLKERVDASR